MPSQFAAAHQLQAWTPFNITGHPAVSLMTGLSRSGLPLSMQLVVPVFGETLVLKVAAAYERCTEWRSLSPGPSAHSSSSSHSMMCWVRRTCLPEPSLRRNRFRALLRRHSCWKSSRPPDGLTIRQAGTWSVRSRSDDCSSIWAYGSQNVTGGANRTCLLHPESRTRYDSFVSKGSADAVRTIRVEPRVDRTSSRSLPQRTVAETGPALAYDRCRCGEICPDSASSFGFPKAASANTHR
jgi:hypothetical protein